MTARLGLRLGDQPLQALCSQANRGRLWLDQGAARLRIRSSVRDFIRTLRFLYGAFPYLPDNPGFADHHVELLRGRWIRAFLQPQSRFRSDGQEPFEPFPLSGALPLFEWGVNWSFAQRANQYILLHAGVVARAERAVIMAAPPGSGKSTLAAALMLSGFRLLSDEFGVLDPNSGQLLPMLKPVALKNQSVDVIRAFSDQAVIGPLFVGTRKGDVAHLAPNEASTDGLHRAASPALVVFPAFEAGSAIECHPMAGEDAFAHLAFNSFNYQLLGPIGFHAVADVIATCPAYRLRFGHLEAAIDQIGTLLDEADGAARHG